MNCLRACPSLKLYWARVSLLNAPNLRSPVPRIGGASLVTYDLTKDGRWEFPFWIAYRVVSRPVKIYLCKIK